MKQIAIIGAGNWGTALAVIATRAGHNVNLWARNPARINLPVAVTGDLHEALRDASMILYAAPSHVARELLTAMSPMLAEPTIIVSVSKGIEIETGKRISEIAKEVAGSAYPFVCLSGPSFAKEVVAGYPTAIVAASKDSAAARTVQNDLSFDNLRIYTNSDVVGTELGGSVKNVMAIAAGMTTGLGFGSNSV